MPCRAQLLDARSSAEPIQAQKPISDGANNSRPYLFHGLDLDQLSVAEADPLFDLLALPPEDSHESPQFGSFRGSRLSSHSCSARSASTMTGRPSTQQTPRSIRPRRI